MMRDVTLGEFAKLGEFKLPTLSGKSIVHQYADDWGIGLRTGRVHRYVTCVGDIGIHVKDAVREVSDSFHGEHLPPALTRKELEDALGTEPSGSTTPPPADMAPLPSAGKSVPAPATTGKSVPAPATTGKSVPAPVPATKAPVPVPAPKGGVKDAAAKVVADALAIARGVLPRVAPDTMDRELLREFGGAAEVSPVRQPNFNEPVPPPGSTFAYFGPNNTPVFRGPKGGEFIMSGSTKKHISRLNPARRARYEAVKPKED